MENISPIVNNIKLSVGAVAFQPERVLLFLLVTRLHDLKTDTLTEKKKWRAKNTTRYGSTDGVGGIHYRVIQNVTDVVSKEIGASGLYCFYFNN